MRRFKTLFEAKARWKAGGFPTYTDDDDHYVCLFLSNDSRFGGSAPQMPKGTRDDFESPEITAKREVSEETGIPVTALSWNPQLIMNKRFRGETSVYVLYAFHFPLREPQKALSNDEGRGLWFTMDDALRFIRRDQRVFLKALNKELRSSK